MNSFIATSQLKLQVAMDYLIKLDIANAMPIFRDYLIIMNELVEHPDQVSGFD